VVALDGKDGQIAPRKLNLNGTAAKIKIVSITVDKMKAGLCRGLMGSWPKKNSAAPRPSNA